MNHQQCRNATHPIYCPCCPRRSIHLPSDKHLIIHLKSRNGTCEETLRWNSHIVHLYVLIIRHLNILLASLLFLLSGSVGVSPSLGTPRVSFLSSLFLIMPSLSLAMVGDRCACKCRISQSSVPFQIEREGESNILGIGVEAGSKSVANSSLCLTRTEVY